jgi:hypothetical protein
LRHATIIHDPNWRKTDDDFVRTALPAAMAGRRALLYRPGDLIGEDSGMKFGTRIWIKGHAVAARKSQTFAHAQPAVDGDTFITASIIAAPADALAAK